MPGPSLTRIDGPSGGILRRLHRDDRGLASIEFILSAPVILLIVLFVKHANLLSTRKIDTMREMRNAAFAEANGMLCVSDFSSALPLPDPSSFLGGLPESQGPSRLSCSSKPSHEGGGNPKRTFVWDDVNSKAKDVTNNLAGKLSDEKPKIITAKAVRVYSFSAEQRLTPYRWSDTFNVDDRTLFSSTSNDTTRRGYDPTLRKVIRDAAPDAGDLFDGIFPGAK